MSRKSQDRAAPAPPVPAAGYLRRSTDKQKTSLEDQRKAVPRYAGERGYTIIRWYTDDGISGDDTEKRVAFLQMIADAQQLRDFKAILCWDQSRFGRFDSLEYGFYVHPLRKAGVRLATVQDGVIDWDSFTGRVIGSLNQEQKHASLRQLGADVTRGLAEAAEGGSWIGSKPYGYRIEGPKKAKRLGLDDPGKVRVVQRIFREFVHDRGTWRTLPRG
jgi:DNA invertase Pin-like site-specific DNA recombinase